MPCYDVLFYTLISFLQIVINKRIVGRRNQYSGIEHISKFLNATSMWLGCEMDENGKKIGATTSYGMRIASVE